MDIVLLLAVLAGLGVFLWKVLKPSPSKNVVKPISPPPVPREIPPKKETVPDGYVSLYSFTPLPVGWRCPVCDAENTVESLKCQVCGQLRPVNRGSF